MPGLNAKISLEHQKFIEDLHKVESAAKATARRMEFVNTTFGGFSPESRAARLRGRDQQIRDAVDTQKRINAAVLSEQRALINAQIAAGSMPESWAAAAASKTGGRGGGPGKWGAMAYGGAVSAMYVSVARDTFASLASGANPFTVMMQQGPQLLQAMTMTTGEMRKFAMRLVPAGLAAGAFAAAGYAVAKLAQGAALIGLSGYSDNPKLIERNRQLKEQLAKRDADAARAGEEDAKDQWNSRSNTRGIYDQLGDARLKLDLANAKTAEEEKEIRIKAARSALDVATTAYEASRRDDISADPRKSNKALQDQVAMLNAQAALAELLKPEESGSNSIGKSLAMLTDWERAGGSLGGQNLMLDVSKAQLTELREIKNYVRQGRGVTF